MQYGLHTPVSGATCVPLNSLQQQRTYESLHLPGQAGLAGAHGVEQDLAQGGQPDHHSSQHPQQWGIQHLHQERRR